MIRTVIELPVKQGKFDVTLSDSEKIANPNSPKEFIYGPAVVHFNRHPDGGIEYWVEAKEYPSLKSEPEVKAKAEPKARTSVTKSSSEPKPASSEPLDE